jgi:UDP:flavonoid glycosyltransferase YjiC (YdhE family)
MRALFATAAGTSHIMGVIPLANAYRAAGYEVLFATTAATEIAARAGFHVVDVAPGARLGQIFSRFTAQNAELNRREAAGIATTAEANELAAAVFGQVAAIMAKPFCELADLWRPDVVVYTPLQSCGQLLAARLGVPAVEQMDGLSGGKSLQAALFVEMQDLYQRFADGHRPADIQYLDVVPPSMSTADDDAIPMRFMPYTTGRQLPGWMFLTPDRPRYIVTFGTVLPHTGHMDRIGRIIGEMAKVDASFLLGLGGLPADQVGELPPNITAYTWLPVDVLVQRCTGMIHHGGQASMLTAACYGVPQLVIPHEADQFGNARAVAKRGIGLATTEDTVTADEIRQLAADPALRAVAQQVMHETAAMPTPAEVVRRLDGRA